MQNYVPWSPFQQSLISLDWDNGNYYSCPHTVLYSGPYMGSWPWDFIPLIPFLDTHLAGVGGGGYLGRGLGKVKCVSRDKKPMANSLVKVIISSRVQGKNPGFALTFWGCWRDKSDKNMIHKRIRDVWLQNVQIYLHGWNCNLLCLTHLYARYIITTKKRKENSCSIFHLSAFISAYSSDFIDQLSIFWIAIKNFFFLFKMILKLQYGECTDANQLSGPVIKMQAIDSQRLMLLIACLLIKLIN